MLLRGQSYLKCKPIDVGGNLQTSPLKNTLNTQCGSETRDVLKMLVRLSQQCKFWTSALCRELNKLQNHTQSSSKCCFVALLFFLLLLFLNIKPILLKLSCCKPFLYYIWHDIFLIIWIKWNKILIMQVKLFIQHPLIPGLCLRTGVSML